MLGLKPRLGQRLCVVARVMVEKKTMILHVGIGAERLESLLGARYQLACVSTVEAALNELRSGQYKLLCYAVSVAHDSDESMEKSFKDLLKGEFEYLEKLNVGALDALSDAEILQRVEELLGRENVQIDFSVDDSLAAFDLDDYVVQIGKVAANANTTQEIADFAVRWLYENMRLKDGSPACAFTRFFRTISFERLRSDLKSQLVEQLGSAPQAHVKCLTLMSGCGESDYSNTTCIPLDSQNLSQKVPMISLIVKELGLDSNKIVSADPGIFIDPDKKKYSVFHMDNLSASPFLGIESVMAFGAYLPSGDFFATMMMLKVKISIEKAEEFKALARATEAAILDVIRRKGEGVAILLADSSYDKRVMNLLHKRYRLIVAFSMEQVKVALDTNEVALIICDTRFDDSRMFELLANSRRNHNTTPIVCVRIGKRDGAQALHTAVDKAVLLQGARLMINAHTLPDEELLRIFQAYLPEPIWRTQ